MEQQTKPAFLEFMPVSIFGSVMGLTALSFAWALADHTWHLGMSLSKGIGWTALIVFLVLTGAYGVKWARYPATVTAEFKNPVSVAFFSTVIISLLLIPGILLPYTPTLAKAVWLLGVALIFLFALFVLRKWTGSQQAPESAMPVWVLPVTGTLNVPIVGNSFRFAGAHELCLAFFGVGIVFIMMLMTIIIARLFFRGQLAPTAQASLLILAAPFALAFSGYEGLNGTPDIAASAFFYFTLFLLLLFGSKIALLPKSCPFHVSWWSVSFPLASVTIAALRYSDSRPDPVHRLLAGGLLLLTTGVILYLLVQTLFQAGTGRFGTANAQPRQPAPLAT
ncbi:MAG TPA: SLAC1 anion channel family protein [Puia sp.]|jgi:tellurite resistance protein